MAPGDRIEDIGIAPSGASELARYDRDVYTWSREQADMIRAGKWTQIDRENVAEEIESLGPTTFSRASMRR